MRGRETALKFYINTVCIYIYLLCIHLTFKVNLEEVVLTYCKLPFSTHTCQTLHIEWALGNLLQPVTVTTTTSTEMCVVSIL